MGCIISIDGNWEKTPEDAVDNLFALVRYKYNVNTMKVIKHGQILLEYGDNDFTYSSIVTIVKGNSCDGSPKYYAYIRKLDQQMIKHKPV